MQFGLRTLLFVVTAVAVVCSLTRWLHELGIAISTLSVGIAFLAIGIRQKRKSHIVGGCALIVALVFWTPWLLTASCWVGHKMVSVTVRVHDRSGVPIPNATVRLTDKIGSSNASTDSSGSATVGGVFQACGTVSLFKKTGIIELLGERLTVKAVGFEGLDAELADIVPRGCWDLYAPMPPECRAALENRHSRSASKPTVG